MKLHVLITLILGLFLSSNTYSQGFPSEMDYKESEHILYTGGNKSNGLYEEDKLETIDLSFTQANYWALLAANKASGTELEATLTYKGDTYPGVGVRFKGNTSYNNVPGDKKSFNVTTDFVTAGADIDGYETFNFNNCFQDESFIREVFYLNSIQNHIPAAKSNYIQLTLNGEDWGIYPNVQQLNAEFIREWFSNDEGSRWRAQKASTGGGPGGGGPGGGTQWGSGTGALNYLGSNQADYEDNYTLKSSTVANPWTDLINTCDILDNGSLANMEANLPSTMDIDRALWFLAAEILFTDDDGYAYKGTMDYLLYFDIGTNRMVPLEFDGNSVMDPGKATWSPFYNENNANYPLMNRLFAIPGLRQRYLAHIRTLVEETFEPTIAHAKIDEYAAFIDAAVQADPKKLYTYNAFVSGVTELKDFVSTRYNFLNSNNEFNRIGPSITNSSFETNGVLWENPDGLEEVDIKATLNHNLGISSAWLYFATGLEGNFDKIEMFDDGAHNDGAAGDGVYGEAIMGYAVGTTVRYYIEAIANNAQNSASYMPQGAEHNIFVYKVNAVEAADKSIVINEIMAKNKTGATDEAGQTDDWIELYNKSTNSISLDGWNITDNQFNVTKFTIPTGTTIGPDEYVIIWADEDSNQGALHANFKLSGDGEALILFNSVDEVVDEIEFPTQTDDIAYARVPNGTGNLIFQSATHKGNNDVVGIRDRTNESLLSIYPNPTQSSLMVNLESNEIHELFVMNALGQVIFDASLQNSLTIDVSSWNKGVYFLKTNGIVKRFIIN
jgi:hypothetical protein